MNKVQCATPPPGVSERASDPVFVGVCQLRQAPARRRGAPGPAQSGGGAGGRGPNGAHEGRRPQGEGLRRGSSDLARPIQIQLGFWSFPAGSLTEQ